MFFWYIISIQSIYFQVFMVENRLLKDYQNPAPNMGLVGAGAAWGPSNSGGGLL